MGNAPEDPSAPWPCDWEAHWEQQVLTTARQTTPLQRLQWLEQMLDLLRPMLPELLRNRERVLRDTTDPD